MSPDDDSDDTTRDESPGQPIDRRDLLRATGGTGAVLLAGCTKKQTKQYDAGPVSLSGDAAKLGYTLGSSQTVQTKRSKSVKGVTFELTIKSRQVTYDGPAAAFGAVATPRAKERGKVLNPVATAPLSDLVEGKVGDANLKKSPLGGRNWSSGPERADSRSATVLGTDTTLETYVGVTSKNELAFVSIARVNDGGDAVVVGGSRSRKLDGSTNATEAIDAAVEGSRLDDHVDIVVGTLPHVVRQKPVDLSLSLADVPVDLLRRAVDHVQKFSGTEVAPEWEGAHLSGEVQPVYRPDVEGIAYYELPVEPNGFVVLATDDHDHPIGHWNDNRPPVSQQLGEKANGDLDTYYKLDTLYWVGENESGERVADWGSRLPKVAGVSVEDVEGEHPTSSRKHELVDPDAEVGNLEFETVEEGPQDGDLTGKGWESWQAMRDGYAENYRPFLQDLARAAREEWQFLRELSERGIGLLEGDQRRIVFLSEDADHELTGPGAELVSTELVEDYRQGRGALELTVENLGDERAPFSVEVEYGDGRSESIKFAIAPPEVDAELGSDAAVDHNADAALGEAVGGTAAGGLDSGGEATVLGDEDPGEASVSATATTPDAEVTDGNLGGWSFWRAGTGHQQREYFQFGYQGCPVGCGPVAWAMLFGWADFRAAQGSNRWSRQRWLFRKNGGKHPKGDVKAPNSVVRGNAAHEIIKELNGTLNTVCKFGGGLTVPWNMPKALNFLYGRAPGFIWCWWNSATATQPWLRRRARAIIRKLNTPAIIGNGMPKHYPLAWLYAHKTERKGWGPWRRTVHHHAFYCNQGHGDCCSGWINGRTWFAGLFFTHDVVQ